MPIRTRTDARPRAGPAIAFRLAFACLVLLFARDMARAEDAPSPDAAAALPSDSTGAAEEASEESLEDEITEEDPEDRRQRLMGPGVILDPEEWTVEWRNGFHVVRADKRFELLIGAQTMFEGAVFHLADDLRVSEEGWNTAGQVRRGRIFGQGVIAARWYFKVSYEIADVEFKDAFAGVLDVGPARSIQLGYMKAPFSIEQVTSLRNITFLERSLADALVPDRKVGGMASGVAFDENLRWAVGAFYESDSIRATESAVDGIDQAWAVTARLTGTPIWEDDGRHLLMLGLSIDHSETNAVEGSISVRPETDLVDPLLDTGPISGVERAERLGLEAAWVRGPLTFQGETLFLQLGREGAADSTFWGGYVQGAWILTGERRHYGRASGVFGRVVPDEPFDPREGKWGALEVAARLSYLDLNSAAVRGGVETNLTLGLNWFLRTNLRVTGNYIHAHVNGDGNADVFQARLQLDF